MTEETDEYPPAPRLRQEEFNDDTDNTNLVKYDTAKPEEQQTPLSLVIPTFDSVHTLPTPMVYTPPAILPRSPLHQVLHIPKRRGDPDQIRKLDVNPQHRVVSELFPLPESTQHRVSSLPTVSETSLIDDPLNDKNAQNGQNYEDDDDTFLTGFTLDHLDQPLKWRKVKEIGSGNFSNVYLYDSLDQRYPKLRQVTVKRIKYPAEVMDSSLTTNHKYKEILSRLESSLTRELATLKSLDYPCIVKLYGINDPIFIQSKKPLRDMMAKNHRLARCDMIMSYCAGGDLLMAASSCNGELELWLIQRLFAELVLAVKYLHENCIIHRDLKLENILLKFPLDAIIDMKDSPLLMQTNIIELADFGLCKSSEPGEMCTARCGSEDYVSPEILMGVPYDGRLSDTWAMGVILYGLLEDRLPFDPPPNASARQRNRATSHRIARYDWKWFRLENENISAKEIVEHTLTRKSQRWLINDIFNCEFVRGVAESLPF